MPSRLQDVRKTGWGLSAAVASLASASVFSLRLTPLHKGATPSTFGRLLAFRRWQPNSPTILQGLKKKVEIFIIYILNEVSLLL